MASGGGDRSGNGVRPVSAPRLAAIFAAYGANPARWPAAERAAAEAASNANSTNDAREARALDAALDLAPQIVVPAALGPRILWAFDEEARLRRAGVFAPLAKAIERARDIIWPGAPLWQPASALAVSLIVELVVGILVPSDVYAHGEGDAGATATLADTPLADLGPED